MKYQSAFSAFLLLVILAISLPSFVFAANKPKSGGRANQGDRLDALEFSEGLKKATDCILQKDFSCAKSELDDIQYLAKTGQDKLLWQQALNTVMQGSILGSGQQSTTLASASSPDQPRVATGLRIALVIGNGAYKNVPQLDNPTNDAKLIAKTLLADGFDLVGGAANLDLDKQQMETALEAFGRSLSKSPGGTGLIYYAGHGMQVDGENYLLAVDANPTKPADLRRQALAANDVVKEMEQTGTKLNVVILDACRNNPFGGRGLRDAGSGLAQIKAPKGTLIAYATQPGNVAQDGSSGGNSPFARSLSESLRLENVGILETFNEVGNRVSRLTNDEQQPWTSHSPIDGKFCFAGCK